MAQQGGSGKNSGESDRRAQRLAAALRENLRRRKAHVRARTKDQHGKDNGPTAGQPGPPEDEPR